MECAGEFVLVDGGGSFHPEEQLDVEAGVGIGHDFGFAKWGISLKGLVIGEEELADEGGEIYIFGGRICVEGGAGDLGEFWEREVFLLPMVEDFAAEGVEKWIHGSSLAP